MCAVAGATFLPTQKSMTVSYASSASTVQPELHGPVRASIPASSHLVLVYDLLKLGEGRDGSDHCVRRRMRWRRKRDPRKAGQHLRTANNDAFAAARFPRPRASQASQVRRESSLS